MYRSISVQFSWPSRTIVKKRSLHRHLTIPRGMPHRAGSACLFFIWAVLFCFSTMPLRRQQDGRAIKTLVCVADFAICLSTPKGVYFALLRR